MSTASMLEAEMEGLNELNDSESTTTCEPENPQGLQDVDQQMDSATSEPAQDEDEEDEGDSVFTGPLADHLQREVKSEFQGDIVITFDTQDENMRAETSLLPRTFYRTFYETSATLSAYVTVDTHVKHRERKDLKIDDGNAFQAVAKFSVRQSMLRETIERHLVWNTKRIPSPYISVFNARKHAERRAAFHYAQSQRIGQRVSVAGINTKNLIPATIRGVCKSTITISPRLQIICESAKLKTFTRQVDIPVWIHKKAKEQHGNSITPEQWEKSGADMWISITELRLSNLKTARPWIRGSRDTICAKGHNYEWLCCGAISKSRVTGVWPWVKKTLHLKDPGYTIQSCELSGQPWVWSWDQKLWLPDTFSHSSNGTHNKNSGTKRKRTEDAASEDKDKRVTHCKCSKTFQPLSMSTIMSIEADPTCPEKP